MAELLEGETAIVTGGSSGIGRAIATQFAANGADVVIADIQKEPRGDVVPTLEVIETDTESAGSFVECDVTRISDLEKAVAKADDFGGVSVMVNNAGIFQAKDVFELTERDYERLMEVNVKGAFFGSQVAADRMRGDDGGVILNMSSTSGFGGRGGWVTYCTAKAAIRNMTFALADAFGPHGIRVNAIVPGLIETAMYDNDVPRSEDENEETLAAIPSGRSGKPEDVGKVAVMLASDFADYVNAETVLVDGGLFNT